MYMIKVDPMPKKKKAIKAALTIPTLQPRDSATPPQTPVKILLKEDLAILIIKVY